MKKILVSIIAVMSFILVVSCGGGGKKSGGYELALITDVGTIDDRSFNQGS